MTREEMAQALESIVNPPISLRSITDAQAAIDAAAAELRQTCAWCKHFERGEAKRPEWTVPMTWVSCQERHIAVYQFEDDTTLPKDGSGFCHRWEVK